MTNSNERSPMRRTRHQAQEAMFGSRVQGSFDRALQITNLPHSSHSRAKDLQGIPAAASIIGGSATLTAAELFKAATGGVSTAQAQERIDLTPPPGIHAPVPQENSRAYKQLVTRLNESGEKRSSAKVLAEKTPVAGNKEQLRSLEIIQGATLENASISGTDIAMIQTFQDGTKHLIAGSLIDPNLPPLDMDILPISPLKVARSGNIVVAVGGQSSSIDQGAVWISMDGGKTGVAVTDSSGQFLEVSLPDLENIFLVQGEKTAENQPAYLKMINLARPQEIKPLGTADPKSTSDALKLQSTPNTYRTLSVDYRNLGYWEKLIRDGKIISNTLKAQDQGFIQNVPLQFYDTDGKIVDVLINESTRGIPPNPDWPIGSIVYIKGEQQPFLIQPLQSLFGNFGPLNPSAAIFNYLGDGYMAVEVMAVTNDGNYWYNPYIVKLGRDYKDFTQQQLIARPGINGFTQKLKRPIQSLHFIEDSLYAVTDKGVFKQTSAESWAQVNSYKIASDPTPTPTSTDPYPNKRHLPYISIKRTTSGW